MQFAIISLLFPSLAWVKHVVDMAQELYRNAGT